MSELAEMGFPSDLLEKYENRKRCPFCSSNKTVLSKNAENQIHGYCKNCSEGWRLA